MQRWRTPRHHLRGDLWRSGHDHRYARQWGPDPTGGDCWQDQNLPVVCLRDPIERDPRYVCLAPDPGRHKHHVSRGSLRDSTVACAAALLFIPSVKNPGKAVTSWEEAEQKVEWGILLMGAGAISKGFAESSLAAYLGEELGELSDFSSLGMIALN